MSEQSYDTPGEIKGDASPSEENAADSKALSRSGQKTSAGVAERELGGPAVNSPFAPKSDRPYHGPEKGRIETRLEDSADQKLQNEAKKLEDATISKKADVYSQHGNVGFAGSYGIGWEVER